MESGTQIDSYTLIEEIGKGGQAIVWAAWDSRRERIVALKLVDSDPSLTQPFTTLEREAQLVVGLHHPHILPLYELGTAKTHLYFAARYVSSNTLDLLIKHSALDSSVALHLLAQIASALSYIHANHIIHRDIKPSNILMDAQGNAYLADFGIARQMIDVTAPMHTGHGTPIYASPEQHMRTLMSPRSDIYSLGIVAYQAFTGCLPWGDEMPHATYQINTMADLPDPRAINPDLPEGLGAALRHLTAPKPEDRPASGEDAFNVILNTFPPMVQEAVRSLQAASTTVYSDDVHRQLSINDGLGLLDLYLPDWSLDSGRFPLSLARFALIDWALGEAPNRVALTREHLQFMLVGALTHDYRADRWAKRLSNPSGRVEVYEAMLHAHATSPHIGRVLEQMLTEPDAVLRENPLFPAALEQLVTLAAEGADTTTRSDAFALLNKVIQPETGWSTQRLSPSANMRLAVLAASNSPLALQAARLIGRLRSEQAVTDLLNLREQIGETKLHSLLTTIRAESGSLPRAVPLNTQWALTARRIGKRLVEDEFTRASTRALLGIAAAAIISLLMALGVFKQVDLQLRDTLFQPYPVSDIVTIVQIDDASLERYGRFDSWPRSLHAEMIHKLQAAGASTIVFDITFASETANDQALVAAMADAGNVVHPALGEGDAHAGDPGVAEYDGGVWPAAALADVAAALGHTNVLHDQDGYVRRMPTMISIDNQLVPSLPIAALQAYLGANGAVQPGADGTLDTIGRAIPVGSQGDMYIHFAGAPLTATDSTFNTVTYQDVMDGNADLSLFEGKIVLIGITATAQPDRYLTAVSQGRPMYGVEILANAIETIWSERFIHLPALPIQIAILLMLGAVIGLSTARPWVGLLVMLGLIGFYYLLAVALFDGQGILLSLLYPILTIGAAYMLVTAYRLSVEMRQRRQVMQLFEARVSPRVAKEAMRAVEQGQINLGGEVQEITVLFADIRGYTAFSEVHEPQEVMQMVNTFLGMVGDSVLAHEGTLANYEGDQVMAFYNAPINQPDHPLLAVQSALDARDRVEKYRASLPADHPYQAIDFGYGIYTGRAVVGYTGSAHRYEYTALGDTVNIAARLTALAEGGQIMVGASTYDRIESEVKGMRLPPVAIKGRTAPVSIFCIGEMQSTQPATITTQLPAVAAAG